MKYYFIRHTTPMVNPGHSPREYCYGCSDLALADTFAEETEQLKQKLKKLNLDTVSTVFSSPLKRCSELAVKLYPPDKITVDDRLTEMHFGQWELQPWDSIAQSETDQWTKDLMHYRPGGGENLASVVKRCDSLLSDIQAHQHDREGDIVFITHGGVIRAMLYLLLGQGPDETIAEAIPFGSIVQIELNRGFTIN